MKAFFQEHINKTFALKSLKSDAHVSFLFLPSQRPTGARLLGFTPKRAGDLLPGRQRAVPGLSGGVAAAGLSVRRMLLRAVCGKAEGCVMCE